MTPVRLLLNSGFTGANAFFALAQAHGLFREAALDVRFTPGRGAYTAASRLVQEGFDAAYGDVNALIEMAARNPSEDLPIAIFMAHQHAPSCIAVARAGPIHRPADLAGRRIVGHASDVALRTFAAYARSAALASDAVQIDTSDAGMAELLLGMLDGKTDAVFGYTTTHTAALAGARLAAGDVVRFLPYRDVCVALYGSALMASPQFIRDHPAALVQLLGATRAAMVAAHAQPQAAIDAVLSLNPQADRQIEGERWQGTLTGDMGWPPGMPGGWEGLGDVENQRLAAAIENLSAAFGWLHTPTTQRVFTRRFFAGNAPASG